MKENNWPCLPNIYFLPTQQLLCSPQLMHLLHIHSFSVSSHKNAYVKSLVGRDIYEPRDVFAHSCMPS